MKKKKNPFFAKVSFDATLVKWKDFLKWQSACQGKIYKVDHYRHEKYPWYIPWLRRKII